MSIFFRRYRNTTNNEKTLGKWYARTVTLGKTVELEDLAEHMAEHHSPYSEGVIMGVLTDMVKCIRELVLEGKSVKIPNLCIFSAGITTTGAESYDEFSVASNVKSAYLKARSTGRFTREEVTKKASFRELPDYNSRGEDASGGGSTGGNGGGGDDNEPVVENPGE